MGLEGHLASRWPRELLWHSSDLFCYMQPSTQLFFCLHSRPSRAQASWRWSTCSCPGRTLPASPRCLASPACRSSENTGPGAARNVPLGAPALVAGHGQIAHASWLRMPSAAPPLARPARLQPMRAPHPHPHPHAQDVPPVRGRRHWRAGGGGGPAGAGAVRGAGQQQRGAGQHHPPPHQPAPPARAPGGRAMPWQGGAGPGGRPALSEAP